MINYWKEIKASAIIFIFLCLMFLITFLISLNENLFYEVLVFYLLLNLVVVIAKGLFKNKIIDRINEILLMPFGVIWAIGIFLIPIFSLVLNIAFYFLFSFAIPHYLLSALETLGLLDNMSSQSILYLRLTSFVILCVLFNYQIKWLVYRLSPVRTRTSEKIKAFKLETISDYVLDSKNIRFIIYSIYVILLISINLYSFNDNSLWESQAFDKVVLQSFITFIAFDRALILFKDFDLKPSAVLEKLLDSISSKIKSYKQNEN